MPCRNEKQALSRGQKSLAVQQHCLRPHREVRILQGKLLFLKEPCIQLHCSDSPWCRGDLCRASALMDRDAQTTNRTIRALWLSLLAAVHPTRGLVLLRGSPNITTPGEEAGVGSRAAGTEVPCWSLWEGSHTATSTRSKIGKERGGSEVSPKSLANATADFQEDPFLP